MAATGKRAIVRREDISQYAGKSFKTSEVLAEASAHLEEVFGLKIVEITTESKSSRTSTNVVSSSQAGTSRHRSAPASRAYILTNMLTSENEEGCSCDDEECSFYGILTVVVALLFVSPNAYLSEGMSTSHCEA